MVEIDGSDIATAWVASTQLELLNNHNVNDVILRMYCNIKHTFATSLILYA